MILMIFGFIAMAFMIEHTSPSSLFCVALMVIAGAASGGKRR
jgi:hypothetical protein